MSTDLRRLRCDGRIAGALYLIVVLSGMFCLAYVPSQLGATMAEASQHVGLFRAGLAAFMLMQVAFLLLPMALYRVLGDLDKPLAVMMVVFVVVGASIGLIALTHRLEALSLLQGDAVATDAGATEAAFTACLQRYGFGLRIASLFWGLWLLPLGWLVLRSGRLPRLLGVLLVLGGVGYIVKVFGNLAPGFADSWLGSHASIPAAFGEIGTCLWLLLFGVRAGRNDARPSASRPHA